MSCYDQLAACYDELTGDVAYEQRADYLERLFRRAAMHNLTYLTALNYQCSLDTFLD